MGKIRLSLSKIASEIAKSLSLAHHKHLAYRCIVHDDFHVMIGLCAEPNRFTSDEFYIYYFYQPLYIPFPYINFALGDRIGEWEKENLSIALPVVKSCYEQLPCDSIATVIDKVINQQLPYFGSVDNKYELLAYSYLVIDRYDEARGYLNKIVAFENSKNAEWYIDQVKRAKMLLDMMNQNKRSEIKATLLEWQKYTMSELKLPEL